MKGYHLEKIKTYCIHKTCKFGKTEVDETCLSDHPECCEVVSIPIDQDFEEELHNLKSDLDGEIWHCLKENNGEKIEISNMQRFRINNVIKWTDNIELLDKITEYFYPEWDKQIQ